MNPGTQCSRFTPICPSSPAPADRKGRARGAEDETGWMWRETENRTNGDRTIPLFVKWFLDTKKQSHFGRRYSWRNIGCREITSISSALRQQTWRDTLSGGCLSKRNRVAHVKSGLLMSKMPSCFDPALEIILRISWAGAFKGCFPFIAELFQTAHSEFVFMFSLDTKALNKRLYHFVIGQLTQSGRLWDTFLHFYMLCAAALTFKIIICHTVHTCKVNLFARQEDYFTYLLCISLKGNIQWIVESIWNSFTPTNPLITLQECYIETRNIFLFWMWNLVKNNLSWLLGHVLLYFRWDGLLYMCIV